MPELVAEKDCTRIYLRRGRVAHLARPYGPLAAMCHSVPDWASEWLGTGNQGEYEQAAELPTCKRCAGCLAERHRDRSWLPNAVRLFTPRSKTAHLSQPGNVIPSPECGARAPGGMWLGLTDPEREKALGLRLCRRCFRALDDYYSEPFPCPGLRIADPDRGGEE